MLNTTLLLHKDVTLNDQFVMLSGNAYSNCKFLRCTLGVNDTPFSAENCEFADCIVQINVLMNDMQKVEFVKAIVETFGKSVPRAPEAPVAMDTQTGQVGPA